MGTKKFMNLLTNNKYDPPSAVIAEIMFLRRMTKITLAKFMNISAAKLRILLEEECEIDLPLALGLERAFGINAGFWLTLQYKYDLSRVNRVRQKTGGT